MAIRTARSTAAFFAPLVLALLAAACGNGASSVDWSGELRDSAGVTVVANSEEGIWQPGEAWSVVREATFGGGTDEARPEYLLGQVAALAVDEEGNVYVVDAGAQNVRAFAPDGTHLRTYGSPGSGPGELGGFLSGVAVSDGRLFVVDAIANQRITIFDVQTGEPLGSVPFDITKGLPIRWDSSEEHVLVAQRRMASFTPGEAQVSSEPQGDPVVVLDEEGEAVDTLVVLPPGRSFQMRGGEARVRIFEAEPVWDLGTGGELAFGLSAEYRIEVRDGEGNLLHVVTKPHTPRPVTEGDRETILDGLRELMEEQGVPAAAMDQVISSQDFADSYPAFALLLMGPDGTLWVQRMRTGEELGGAGFDFQDLGSAEWEVFDADGRYLGVVTMPARVQPLLIHDAAVYGIARDDLDVQTVVRLGIRRPGGS